MTAPIEVVRVPTARGVGGEAMAAAAHVPLPYPGACVIDRPTLEETASELAATLPDRPLVVGGCCCSHIGAIRGLAVRHERLAVVWFDAHGDLNTPETSPSGNQWGMPLRIAIDEGSVAAHRVALIGARALDPPETVFMSLHGIDDNYARVLADADAVYIAFDADVLAPEELACFMPEPGAPTLAEAEATLRCIAASGCPIVGVGLTGLLPESDPEVLQRLVAAAGL